MARVGEAQSRSLSLDTKDRREPKIALCVAPVAWIGNRGPARTAALVYHVSLSSELHFTCFICLVFKTRVHSKKGF